MLEKQLITPVPMVLIIVNDSSEMLITHEVNFEQSAIHSLSPVQEKIIISSLTIIQHLLSLLVLIF